MVYFTYKVWGGISMGYRKICGIYCIKNLVTLKVYIGQSTSCKRRMTDHKYMLRKNEHDNEYLQFAWNKYGETNFEFSILETCEEQDLDDREIFYIRKFNSTNRDYGYNRESGGLSNRKWCRESRDKCTGVNNPMYGKHHTKECKEYIKQRNQGINSDWTEEFVIKLKLELAQGVPYRELARKYGIDHSRVYKILQGKNWAWVLPELTQQFRDTIEQHKQQIEFNKNNPKKSYREQIKERNKSICDDFYINHLTRDQLVDKYNVTRKVINNVTRQYRDNYINCE